MRRRATTRARHRAAVCAAAVAVVLLGAGPATAGPPRAAGPDVVCSAGAPPPPVVAGDLLLGAGCEAVGTRVDGDVRVAPGVGWAALQDVAVGGSVHLGRTTDVSVVGAQVGADVTLDAPGNAYLERVTLDGELRGTVGRALWVVRSVVHGPVRLDAPTRAPSADLWLRGSWFGGWVSLVGGQPRLLGSTLAQGTTLTRPLLVEVCGTRTGASVLVQRAQGPVRLGGPVHLGRCVPGPARTPATVGGSVRLLENAAPVTVAELVVAGDLVCEGSAPPPTVVRTVVRGARSGQCA